MQFRKSFLLTSSFWVVAAFAGVRADTQSVEDAPESSNKSAEIALHNRFIGTWDVSYEIYDKSGKVRHNLGQVTYSWIIKDQAIQEVWSGDSHSKEFLPYGATIAFYDNKHQLWTEVWIYPDQGSTTIVSGRASNGRIVLTGRNIAGSLERWSTSDIQSNSFVSSFDVSEDDGKTWRLVGVNHNTRHGV
ncbi:MAG TPA: hypothetical protein VGD54_13190 [Steroidobacteraceae bacterium]